MFAGTPGLVAPVDGDFSQILEEYPRGGKRLWLSPGPELTSDLRLCDDRFTSLRVL
jgi:hypothetical protein